MIITDKRLFQKYVPYLTSNHTYILVIKGLDLSNQQKYSNRCSYPKLENKNPLENNKETIETNLLKMRKSKLFIFYFF